MLIIGENIHIISPQVKEAIATRDTAMIQRLAREQAEHGARTLDLNIGPQKKEGPEVMRWLIGAVQEVVDVPLSFDTTNLEAIRTFVRACTFVPLPADTLERALCWNMAVPAQIRVALVAREINSDDVLAACPKPALVTHGRKGRVILPAMGEHILSMCSGAQPSWYPETGHALFSGEPRQVRPRAIGVRARDRGQLDWLASNAPTAPHVRHSAGKVSA